MKWFIKTMLVNLLTNAFLLLIFVINGYECISYGLNELINEDKAWKSISCSENGQYVYFIAIYDYIYLSNDYLNSYSVSNNIKRSYNSIFTSSSGQYVIATTADSYIYSSIYFGVNWNELTSIDPKLWVQVSMNSNGQYVYLITIYDSIYYSSNWYSSEDYSISVSNSPIKLWQSISCSSSGQYVYAVAKNDYIYLSSNYGSSWTVSYDTKLIWSAISTSSSGQYVYSLVNGEYIYRSTNYGDYWSISNPSYALWSFVTIANNSVYAVDSFGKIYLSYLTTNSWVKINSNKIQDAIVSVSYDNNSVYVLAPNLPVYSLVQIIPTASPTFISYALSTNDLVALIDFTDSRCYSGSGSNYFNIIDSSSQYFYGNYSQNSDKSMRLNNTKSDCLKPASGIHISSYNVYTVSMWIRRDTTQSASCLYLIDARPAQDGGFYYNLEVGSTWSYISLNGESYTTVSKFFNSYLPLNTWTYITIVAAGQLYAGLHVVSRYTETEGFDCSIRSIYVYSSYISEATNRANYLATSSFFSPTNSPTTSPLS